MIQRFIRIIEVLPDIENIKKPILSKLGKKLAGF